MILKGMDINMTAGTKKHIIFDMDGTLSDTAKATTFALNEIAPQYGLPEVQNSEVRSVMGFADPEFFYRLYPQHPHEILNEVRYKVNYLEDSRIEVFGKDILFPGIALLLTGLSDKGYNLYIASTGSSGHVDTTLESGEIKHLFTGIYCNETDKINMVREIITGCAKEECVMVGDMIKDSEAAKANGILVLGAAFGYLTLENHSLFDAVLDEPNDLYEYL